RRATWHASEHSAMRQRGEHVVLTQRDLSVVREYGSEPSDRSAVQRRRKDAIAGSNEQAAVPYDQLLRDRRALPTTGAREPPEPPRRGPIRFGAIHVAHMRAPEGAVARDFDRPPDLASSRGDDPLWLAISVHAPLSGCAGMPARAAVERARKEIHF